MRITSFLLSAFFSVCASQAFGAGYGPAGCGLGSIVIGSKPGITQIFAATTNGSSGSQTFGISSGTSNCVPAARAQAFNDQRTFIQHNLASLAQDAARGNGETLRAFASTLGCQEQAFPRVAKTLQDRHAQIFGTAGVDGILFATHKVIQGDKNIANQCSNLI